MEKQTKAIQEALSKIISSEAAAEVANLEGRDLIEAFGLVDEQMHHQQLHAEETTVKSLLNSIGDIALAICNLEEGQEYPINTIDAYGTREGTETALERAKSLANVIMESYLYQVYELLGYDEVKQDE